jgi:hypothetical protein
VLGLVALSTLTGQTQANLAARLDAAIRAACGPIDGVSVGDSATPGTWIVHPRSRQACAQPVIDSFNASDPAHETAELTAQATAALDTDRLTSAVVWAVIETLNPPATRAKYLAMRGRILSAYVAQPWKP